MIHLTLNFGKTNRNPKPVLPPQLEGVVGAFLDKGGGTFPAPYQAYRIETAVDTDGAGFYFLKGDDQLAVSIGVWSARSAGAYWAEIEKDYRNLYAVGPQLFSGKHPIKMPDTVPWLATLLLPDFFTQVKSNSSDVEFLNICEFVFFEVAHKQAQAHS